MKSTVATFQPPALPSQPLTRAGAFFMLLPVLLLGIAVFGWIWMIRLAVDDPTAAIEPDYYAQASHIDDHKARIAQSEALGWKTQVEAEWAEGTQGTLRVRMVDRDGAALEGLEVTAIAFPNVRAGDRQELSLSSRGAGTYEGRLSRARAGIWELRLRAKKGSDEFVSTIRFELPRSAQRVSEGKLP